MSQEINLHKDSDDNGECSNTAPIPSLPLSRKRPRHKEEISNDLYPRNASGPGDKTVTGSTESVVDLELADGVEVSPHNKKRRGVVKIERSGKNDAAGKCVIILKGDHVIEEDASSEDGEIAEHHESHEGIAAAVSHRMNLDSKQTCRGYGSAGKHSQKLPTVESPSNASGRQGNVTWKDRLNELADYRKIHGHCNVPRNYSENTKLGKWVTNRRKEYRSHLAGKTSHMTLSHIQELESLGFAWKGRGATWEDRLSELADYRKIHGHCNVPPKHSENTKLAHWVTAHRDNYRLHLEGKTSSMTPSHIQELERFGFHWDSRVATWKDIFSELADYRKIQGHCNVPENYSENTKLAEWVSYQRKEYRGHLGGNTSSMTLSHIQELESLGFEWKPHNSHKKGTLKKPSLDDDATLVRVRAVEAPEHVQTIAQIQIHSNEADVAFEPEESDWNGEVPLAYIPGESAEI